ncbi:hypothetical protein COR50_11615 [Chitinophaga caeni]|uniref:SusD-like N-terminal domain-containing protein n=1 Tax=Chitinophaga caeni TaxID=2029983 RepID=A0A291QUW4_9BACT|nr:RagB/SusD family nutrient uptake outer membrane protein [Chitinophaga caeni]ATL47758.1 hypothetical protein COR50_11615 [Chitinophaga caeni]
MLRIRPIYIYVICLVCLSTAGCKKWLEVKPDDTFTEEMIYKTEAGTKDALNGILLKISSGSLYGMNLTGVYLDLLAQRYRVTNDASPYYSFYTLDLSQSTAKNVLQSFWEQMYQGVANTNRFLQMTEQYKANYSEQFYQQAKGEVHAIRALLYFDLLRMWGPVYDGDDSTAASIPVYSTITHVYPDYAPANEVMDFIVADLDSAIAYMANDPIIESNYDDDNNMRLNYYAAKALKARVLLYRGDKAGAYSMAKEVMQVQDKFPWVLRLNIASNRTNPDRIFGTEVLFGVYNRNLYDAYKGVFLSTLNEGSLLAAGPDFLNTVYESLLGDFRYGDTWLQASDGVSYRTFFKYAPVSDAAHYKFNYTVPVIRMSEMYLIAAETAPDPAEGLSYINEIRLHRGLDTEISDPAQLTNEIRKSYIKEFYGEGQLWFFYKRTKATSMISPAGNRAISLGKYVFDYPDSETQQR